MFVFIPPVGLKIIYFYPAGRREPDSGGSRGVHPEPVHRVQHPVHHLAEGRQHGGEELPAGSRYLLHSCCWRFHGETWRTIITEDFYKSFSGIERQDLGSHLHDQRVLREGPESELQRGRNQREEGPEGLLRPREGQHGHCGCLYRQYVDVK